MTCLHGCLHSCRRWALPRIAAVAALTVAVAGCASAPRTHADASAEAACNARADEVFNRQNRGAVYRSDRYQTSSLDSPFSATGTGSVIPTNLEDEYSRDQVMQACLAGIGQAPGTAIEATPGAVTPTTISPGPAPAPAPAPAPR